MIFWKKIAEKISKQNVKIEKLESIISIHENTIDQLLVKCDDNKQYSKRSCFCIYGVEVKEKRKRTTGHEYVRKMLFKFKCFVRSKWY